MKVDHQLKTLILRKVISLENNHGHLKWKVSDLARIHGINRPLIYYHFGNTKKKILDTCLSIIADDVFGMSEERMELVRQGGLLDSLLISQKLFKEAPEVAVFYYRWRPSSTSLQKKFMDIEERYLVKLRHYFPKRSGSEILAIYGMMHGLVMGPFVTEEALRAAFPMILKFAHQ